MARSHNNGYQSMLNTQFSTSPNSYHSTHDALLRHAHEDSNGAMAQPEEQRTSQVTTRSSSSDTLHALSKGQDRKSDNEDSDDEMQQAAERRPLLNHHSNNNNKQKHHGEPHSTLMQVLHALLGEITGSEYLENSGSVARDHLANERTYLAWLRTSLSTISVGVGITQLFRLDRAVEHDPYLRTWGRPVGLIFIFMAMLFLSFAFVRYFHCQTTMIKGYFPASRGIVVFTSTLTLLSMIALLLAVFFKR
ncbi:hypothetical protein AOL_s00075g187 [Lichtheimia corymbifera JMRC:FSU:9682]|uniref:DUF202 domain-containing protein n=1 Tax=Lichtheimia corymbifera JMRC:FSU:9682 TaxID=1263082 RepID=A0A068RMR7_9FUNG|nr:hypothetical protein AOL_s00075g187 [Lichtheimia corymbifera JMRC:FSU:9682]